MRLVGILGGTFDPVHFGHLRPAVEVRAALDLEHVRLIPAQVSPLRSAPGASGAHRIAMLRAAVEGAPDLIVDGRELERDGPSYTIDTLEHIHRDLPDATLFLIMGADAFADFERWDRWRAILDHAHIVVTHRPGSRLQVPGGLGGAVVADAAALAASRAGRVWIQAVTQLDITATRIRAGAAAGGDLRYLMPEAARRYLEEHRLYDETIPASDADRSAG